MINAELARKNVEAFHGSAAKDSFDLTTQIQNKATNIFNLLSNRIINRIEEASSIGRMDITDRLYDQNTDGLDYSTEFSMAFANLVAFLERLGFHVAYEDFPYDGRIDIQVSWSVEV